jgi:hypothetical protein
VRNKYQSKRKSMRKFEVMAGPELTSLAVSLSPRSLIRSTTRVSGMLARRVPPHRPGAFLKPPVSTETEKLLLKQMGWRTGCIRSVSLVPRAALKRASLQGPLNYRRAKASALRRLRIACVKHDAPN